MKPRNIYLDAWDRDGCYCDDTFELEPGVIDDIAVWVFTRGQCHSLALALHERTGWDIVGAVNFWDGDMPGHVGVIAPDGSVLDIEGAHGDMYAWARHNDGHDVIDVDPDRARDAFGGMYREPQVDAASYWVDAVLAYLPTDIASAA